MQSLDPVANLFSIIGSEKPFFNLVEAFYSLVEKDPALRPLYPNDLSAPKEHLALFLLQRFGGRGTYSEQRGHPRMRARHLPFKIGQKERDAWMKNMTLAIDSVPEFAAHKAILIEYFSDFATFLINQPN